MLVQLNWNGQQRQERRLVLAEKKLGAFLSPQIESRICVSLLRTTKVANGHRPYMCGPSSFASPLRLAFSLKLSQQLLCVSQLAFAQPYSLPAHLVFMVPFPSSLINDPYNDEGPIQSGNPRTLGEVKGRTKLVD